MIFFVNFFYRFFVCFCAIGFLWGGGFVFFITTIPDEISDKTTPTDGVVVLTGGEGRIAVGFDLMQRGLAKKLFISGVNPKVTLSALKKEQQVAGTGINAALGFDARNTAGNAREAALWAREEKLKSIRLVTADYHMRRSMVEFQYFLPDVAFIAHPVLLIRPLNQANLRLYGREYHKYLRSKIIHGLHLPSLNA